MKNRSQIFQFLNWILMLDSIGNNILIMWLVHVLCEKVLKNDIWELEYVDGYTANLSVETLEWLIAIPLFGEVGCFFCKKIVARRVLVYSMEQLWLCLPSKIILWAGTLLVKSLWQWAILPWRGGLLQITRKSTAVSVMMPVIIASLPDRVIPELIILMKAMRVTMVVDTVKRIISFIGLPWEKLKCP